MAAPLEPDILVQIVTKRIKDCCVANESNLSGTQAPPSLAPFFSLHPQPFTLSYYVNRLVTALSCSPSVFICALIYLDRVQTKENALQLSELNCHRLFSTAVLLAMKWLDDEAVNNVRFAPVSGMSLFELNRLEVTMLHMLDWGLSVEPIVYYHRERILIRAAIEFESEPVLPRTVSYTSNEKEWNQAISSQADR